jgi:hypothetical protein
VEFLDLFPLDRTHATFRRIRNHIKITLHAERFSSIKSRTSLWLRASSEEELEEWVKYLTVSTAMESFRYNQDHHHRHDNNATVTVTAKTSLNNNNSSSSSNNNGIDVEPYKMINIELRTWALSKPNIDGNTGLHLLALRKTSDSNSYDNNNSYYETIKIAMWLIENGCPIDARNNNRKTACDLAMNNSQNIEFAHWLKQQLSLLLSSSTSFGGNGESSSSKKYFQSKKSFLSFKQNNNSNNNNNNNNTVNNNNEFDFGSNKSQG